MKIISHKSQGISYSQTFQLQYLKDFQWNSWVSCEEALHRYWDGMHAVGAISRIAKEILYG